MPNKTNEEIRTEHVKEVLKNRGYAQVTVWGNYGATGEGTVLMLAYWTVRSEEELKKKIIEKFGDWWGRCCTYAEGFMTQQSLRENPNNYAWTGWQKDFADFDTRLISEKLSQKISSGRFSIDHTQISHWNGS